LADAERLAKENGYNGLSQIMRKKPEYFSHVKQRRFRQYRDYKDAKVFVHTLGLKSRKEWRSYCQSGNKPSDIPSYPEDTYNEFEGMNIWLYGSKIVKEIVGHTLNR